MIDLISLHYRKVSFGDSIGYQGYLKMPYGSEQTNIIRLNKDDALIDAQNLKDDVILRNPILNL